MQKKKKNKMSLKEACETRGNLARFHLFTLNISSLLQIIQSKYNCKEDLLINRNEKWKKDFSKIMVLCHGIHAILSSIGASGWKMLNDLTNSPNSITPLRLTSNKSNTYNDNNVMKLDS